MVAVLLISRWRDETWRFGRPNWKIRVDARGGGARRKMNWRSGSFLDFFEVVLPEYGVANPVISHGTWVANAREAFYLNPVILELRTEPPTEILWANLA
jgi:hypothetical protein